MGDEHFERKITIRPGQKRETAEERRYSKPAYERTAKCVCAKCNGGWMRDLDQNAERVYAPLMRGEVCRMGPGAQRLLAFWAVKVAAVLEYSDVLHPGMSSTQHAWIAKRKAPPPGTKIWIADFDLPGDASYNYEHVTWCLAPATLDPATGRWKKPTGHAEPNSHFSMFVIGRLAVTILGTSSPIGIDSWPLPAELAASLAQVWPLQCKTLSWPPGPPMTQEGLPEFGEGLEDGLITA